MPAGVGVREDREEMAGAGQRGEGLWRLDVGEDLVEEFWRGKVGGRLAGRPDQWWVTQGSLERGNTIG